MGFFFKKETEPPRKIRHLPIGIQFVRDTSVNPKLILGPFEWATMGDEVILVRRMQGDDDVVLAQRLGKSWGMTVDWIPVERHMAYRVVTFFSWNPDNVSDFPVE